MSFWVGVALVLSLLLTLLVQAGSMVAASNSMMGISS